jgi:hypothetical protein
MSAGASATGPRRGPPGLEEATSKKKQKDRANLESKDGDARRGRRGFSRVPTASLITGHASIGVGVGVLSLPPLSWFDGEKKIHGRLGRTWAFHLRDVAKINEMGVSGVWLTHSCLFLLLPVSLPRKEPTKDGEY